jgi:cystathionine beta-lyase/cystathionine gamma-synthase
MFPHRTLGDRAKKAMIEAISKLGEDKTAYSKNVEKAAEAISKITGHRFIRFLSSGNCAIFTIVNALEGKIMIPDQGGWKGFKKYPKLLGKKICTVQTDLGLIDPETLESHIKKQQPQALFITSFAGYIAEQNIRAISEICKENNVLLVEDASGAIGDHELARGDSDVIVCSTGSPKILNLMSGGFISTNKEELLEKSREIIKACKIDPVICAGIIEELKDSSERIRLLNEYSNRLKEYLPKVVHRHKRGICVGFEVDDPKKVAAEAIKRGLITDLSRGFLTVCPIYERFLKRGIVVELKNLDVFRLSEEDISKIGEILNL